MDRGEIDLVIDLDGRRVAVEVKTVVGEDLDPADAFTPAKASQVLRLAGRLHPPIRRVDLVAVRLGPRGVVIRWMVDAG